MNRYEFYANIDGYKNSLKHSWQKYYAKLDNYYPDGTARYFYTKEEWDAYKKEKSQSTNLAEKNKNKRESEIKSNTSREQERIKKEGKVESIISLERARDKAKDITNELYKHKDEIVEKANKYLKVANDTVNNFVDKFMGELPSEMKDKIQNIINEVKDKAGDIIGKINNISDEQIANVNDLIDKVIDAIQNKIDQYSKELSDMFQKYKDKISPVFKDKDGNINWKIYLPIAAAVGIIGFVIKHSDTCYEIFSKIYDTGKKAFNFIDEKTDGKFSAALKKVPTIIDRYWAYNRFKEMGFDKFYATDDNGNKVPYINIAYNNYLEAADGAWATMASDILFRDRNRPSAAVKTYGGHRF